VIRFTKMHGIGNDYIYIDANEYAIDDPVDLAQRIADRHCGVGGDGLILVAPPDDPSQADIAMRMFNADGSESEMCGNGIRCVCKFAHDRNLSKANPMRIATGRGVLSLQYTLDPTGRVDEVTVDMGEPILDLPSIPVAAEHLHESVDVTHTIKIGPMEYHAVMVSMGNPHAVIFTDAIADVRLSIEGPSLERHPAFPSRANIHFVHVHSPDEITMRTWERGSGITMACGTGASAVCVAGVLTGRTSRTLLAHLPGGDLTLHWDETTNHVSMTGPATEVFSGEWDDAAHQASSASIIG